MKKIMLKRSLALGALMAFAITGSALAADMVIGAPSENKNGGGEYQYVGLFVSGEERNLEADTLTFESKNPATNDASQALGTGHNAAVVTNGGKLTINVTDLNIGTNENGGGDRGIRLVGANNELVINAKNIVAYVGDEFVHVRNNAANSKATINTETFYGKTGWGKDDYGVALLQANEGATINFIAKDATFDGPTNDEGGVMGSGGWGTINATVDNLNIDGNLCGSYGSLGGSQYEDKVFSLNVNAGKLVMNGNVNAGSMNTEHSKMSRTTNVVVSATDSASIITGDLNAYEKGNISVSGTSLKGSSKIVDNGIVKLNFNDGNTWEMQEASTVTDVTFGAGSTLKIKGSDFVEASGQYALNGSGTLVVEEGAKLVIEGMDKNTYNIATGFATNQGETFTVVNDNALMQTEMKLTDDNLQAVVSAKTADEIASSGIVTSSGVNMLAEIAGDIASGNVAAESQPAAEFITTAMGGQASGNTTQAAAAAVNSALQLAEAGGNSATAISVVNNVASLTTQRLSFTQLSTTPTGGFGRVVRKDSSGAGVWAQYVHGKDKVDDMPMDGMRSSYDSQYNGALLGFDFKKIGKYQGGVAFSYGEGDSNSKNSAIRTRSDYKFYGVGYYGNIMNDDSNVMFDINFSKSESDVEQHNAGYKLEASPDTTTISAGVKLEKLIQNNEVQIVPYAGLRFLSVDTDEYKANIAGKTAFMYAPDRQNIWLLPVGVSLRQENVYDSGWKVTPKIDLSYIWALGDTDSSMTVSIPGVSAVSDLGYTVMDNGSFLGTIGLEASKGNWSYGLNYSYQKGEYQRSDKWYVDVHYSF
ncbi:MAG: autotransporter domain-containing protein [Phascolarctobacterium sp.]|uniref:autotransporter domain-containing protein n=1 Tax=Phascolarctobacterium sp. TaxID=2049039 RepID=UPI0026DC328E|nr:autotransporter domain-containing protein [Phascolarctobacterium sp.]MDO4921552.1 autotransporter domain-containing protein [Phascolarctobacterium sp.]